jgi:hypothetical protein
MIRGARVFPAKGRFRMTLRRATARGRTALGFDERQTGGTGFPLRNADVTIGNL